jgi:hypothetical protein
MSETKAIALVHAVTTTLVLLVCATLMALGANGVLIAIAFMLIGGFGVDVQSRVILHYAPSDDRRR